MSIMNATRVSSARSLQGATLAFGLVLAGCGAPVEGEEAADTASTSQSLTNVDPCAMGTVSNATATINSSGNTDQYLRAAAWINSICKAADKERTTTIVDFSVHGILTFTYSFVVQPTFWDATNITECVNSRMATRVQRNDNGTWVDVEYREQQGQWVINLSEPNFGHCNTPYFYGLYTNYGDTNMYRVRTWARQSDDTFASVLVTGTNKGHQ
ncbi:hypothetical protein P2318_06535 [Myxococcaceae bacterium GXIMD 01537]